MSSSDRLRLTGLIAARRRFVGLKNPLSRLVVTVSAVLIALGAVLHAVNLKLLHDDAIAAAQADTRNLSYVLADHTERVFEAADRALLAVVNLHDQTVRGERVDRAHLHEILKGIQNQSDVLRRLSWTDSSGHRVETSGENVNEAFDFSRTPSFVAHRDGDPGLYISRPFRPMLGDRPWLAGLSRRLNRLDGSFDGIAMALIDPYYFANLYRSIDLGRTRSSTLFMRDGTILARGADDGASIGRSIGDAELFRDRLPKAESGTFMGRSPVDHVERIVSYASVKNYPLVVSVAMSESEALATWHRQLIFTSAGFLAFLALFLVVAYLLVQQLEHDEQRRKVLNVARRDAVAANRAKSTFLSHMNHELRTPLNAILGFAELIRDRFDPQNPESIQNYAKEIHAAGSHLLDLINDMLDLAKIEAHRRNLDETVVDLRFVADRVLRLHKPVADKASVALNLALSSNLPRLMADERAVIQMLNNLVSNAIKFTPAGGRIEIRGGATASDVPITVSDTGIGIAPQDQTRVFERFGRSTDALVSTPQGGTGLGLAIVKGLIELHGGQVYLSSAPGQGTDVTLRFPASRIAAGRAAAA
jgi:signal transduction histidine kinase